MATKKRKSVKSKATKASKSSKKRKTTKKKVTKASKSSKKRKSTSRKTTRSLKSSSILQIAITLPRPSDGMGPTAYGSRMTAGIVGDFIPEPQAIEKALSELQALGFSVTAKGRLSASVRGGVSLFEKVFGTKLSTFNIKPTAGRSPVSSFYFPKKGAPWKPQRKIGALIDNAYIQWPHIYMNQLFSSTEPSPVPPRVDYHHLRVPRRRRIARKRR